MEQFTLAVMINSGLRRATEGGGAAGIADDPADPQLRKGAREDRLTPGGISQRVARRKAMCRRLRRKPESQGRHPANSYASSLLSLPWFSLGAHRYRRSVVTLPRRRRLGASYLQTCGVSISGNSR